MQQARYYTSITPISWLILYTHYTIKTLAPPSIATLPTKRNVIKKESNNQSERERANLEGELLAVFAVVALHHLAVDPQAEHVVADLVVVGDGAGLGLPGLVPGRGWRQRLLLLLLHPRDDQRWRRRLLPTLARRVAADPAPLCKPIQHFLCYRLFSLLDDRSTSVFFHSRSTAALHKLVIHHALSRGARTLCCESPPLLSL